MFHLRKTHRLVLMIAMAIGYFAVELIVGHFCQSMTLIADSFHMLSDVLALVVALGAVRMSRKPRDRRHTYGFQRAEVLGTLVNTVMLVTLCFTIIVDAFEKLIEPHPIRDPKLMAMVGSGGLLINLIGICLFCGHSHGHSHLTDVPNDVNRLLHYETVVISTDGDSPSHPHTAVPAETDETGPLGEGLQQMDEQQQERIQQQQQHSAGGAGQMNMQAAFLHVLGDTLGSVIVIASALTVWLVPAGDSHELHQSIRAALNENGTCDVVEPSRHWQSYVDPLLSLLLVGIMLCSTVRLLRQALSILMQNVPKEICLEQLKKQLENIDGIIQIHDLHVWQLQSDCYIGTVHIRCRDLPEYMSVSRAAKKIFHDFNIHCTTIQPEFQATPTVSDSQCIIECDAVCDAKGACCPASKSSGDAQQQQQQQQQQHEAAA